ncbi:MAG TPA: serine hydrolase domain-containing protein, partial [Acidimicrobiia bacterium]|nr:serine hydrolase domain-containing protein [Acidimicrobiia bacterium]
MRTRWIPVAPVVVAISVAMVTGVSISSAAAQSDGTATTSESSTTTTTKEPDGIDPAQRSRFSRIASRILEEYEIPGAVVGVFTPEGEWVLTRGYANVNAKRAVRRDDRFGIRSVSKSFTVTALLRLVDRDEVGLDDPISQYVEGVPGGEGITLRELAAMTSGLPDYTDSPEVRAALGEDPTREWTDRELVDAAFALPVEF